MKTRQFIFLSCLFCVFNIVYCTAQAEITDTIFIADYENNQTNSGFSDINPTNASAPDAAYIVPGNASNYAVAHKVNIRDYAYFSNEAFRSESDALYFNSANYLPGDHFRYEFSLYLKDWAEYTSGAPYGTNLFQMKETAGEVIRIATKRNELFVWEPNSPQNSLIEDIRPYINQWIDFKIDVLWTKDATGYINYFIRLPEETSYTLVRSVENIITYHGTGTDGQRGYIKWGVYREEQYTSTDAPDNRIAYHDNVKVFKIANSNTVVSTTTYKSEDLSKNVYPNPTHNKLYFENNSTLNLVEVFDLSGKRQINISTASNNVNISGLSTGIYIAKISNDQKVSYCKFIKK